MSKRRLFAVDLGASGGKCFLGMFSPGHFAMQEVHRFDHEGVPFYIPDRDGKTRERMYWDDILLYRNIIDGLRIFRRDAGDSLDAIGIDTWGADGHVMSRDGDMLGKMYCYRDHRLDPMIDVVKAQVGARRIYEITGIHFQPFNLSNQLHWFVKHRRELLLPGSFFLPAPSLFSYYLGGGRQIDSSWASITQLMDAREKTWSPELLEKLEIPAEIMPKIVEPGTVVGELYPELACSLGLNRTKIVATAAHDTASAFAAAPVDDPADSLIVSSGTWSLVGKLVPHPITSEGARAANVSNEGGIGNIRLLKNCMGTWLVQELRRSWRETDGTEMAWDEITSLAEAAPAFSALIDPDDPGFYNPACMETAIVEYCRRTGQEPPQSRGALLRTVYESLALKYRMVNDQICSVSSSRSKTVNIVGGGSRNELLNRFTADALGLPVQAGPEEATAVGNLMVQAMGMGLIGSIGESLPLIRAAFRIREYKPEHIQDWNAAYRRFLSMCEAEG